MEACIVQETNISQLTARMATGNAIPIQSGTLHFSPIFRVYLKLLYTSPWARVQVNGVVSEPFKIQMGMQMRQGCHLSPLLIALIMKPLAES